MHRRHGRGRATIASTVQREHDVAIRSVDDVDHAIVLVKNFLNGPNLSEDFLCCDAHGQTTGSSSFNDCLLFPSALARFIVYRGETPTEGRFRWERLMKGSQVAGATGVY